MKVSVIIPALNEAANLPGAIGSVGKGPEVIVVDGGSSDGTPGTAAGLGAAVLKCAPGRGAQMDLGANSSTGEVLLFLHADTVLPGRWLEAVTCALKDTGAVAGAFRFSVDGAGLKYRALEALSNTRASRLGLIYGDQALFVRRAEFFAAGGFRGLPLMEDVDLVRRLCRAGKVVLLDRKVSTSSRRWEKGFYSNTAKNIFFISLYFLGASPGRLHGWYYGRGGAKTAPS